MFANFVFWCIMILLPLDSAFALTIEVIAVITMLTLEGMIKEEKDSR